MADVLSAIVSGLFGDWGVLRLSDLQYWHRGEARLLLLSLPVVAGLCLAIRLSFTRNHRRHTVTLPAVLTSMQWRGLALLTYVPLVLALAGIPFLAVALADPFTSPACPSIRELLEIVQDATGLLVIGPNARRTRGPVVVALENAELLPAMLTAAERLSAVSESELLVCLVANDDMGLLELDNATRLVLQDRPQVRIAGTIATFGAEAAAAEALRRLQPGLIVARFGGALFPSDGDMRPLAESLECPLLLVR